MALLVLLFLSLYPLLGQCCSCAGIPNRHQTLKNGICGGGDVYSAVVVGATCNCLSETVSDSDYECRTYSYSPSDESYSAEIASRYTCDEPRFDDFLTTCMQTENVLAPGVILQTGQEPEIENGTLSNGGGCKLPCPFDDVEDPEYEYLCVYMVRVTEVFTGNYSVGDIITTPGPDALTSCARPYGRVLQLNTEYLAGVGGPCSSIGEWELLSSYKEDDLDTLRGSCSDELVWWHYVLIGVGVLLTVLAVTVGLLLVIVLLFKRSQFRHRRLQDTSGTLSSENKVLFKNGPPEAESVELKVPVADASDPIKT